MGGTSLTEDPGGIQCGYSSMLKDESRLTNLICMSDGPHSLHSNTVMLTM